MACGLPVIVTGAGPVLDYASEETAFLIPARRGQFAECRVGDHETIGRPWLHEPDLDALVEWLKHVASDRAGARAKGMVASEHIRNRFTWGHTAEAAERRLVALTGENQNQPRISGSVSSSRTVRISLTMIVRDEQENLPHCLGSGGAPIVKALKQFHRGQRLPCPNPQRKCILENQPTTTT